ncbi:MAG: hypothetical protein RLZZ501_660 [Pseudomonadota bacterium]|jgi:DNA-binding MarR family transcriptional regulator
MVKRGHREPEGVAPAAAGAVDLGPLPRQLGYLLRRAQVGVIHSYAAAFAEGDLRPGQFAVLTVLDRNPGLSPSQVAEALAINRTNFVPLFESLVQRGLAERRANASDRRTQSLYLTPAGQARFEQALAAVERHEQVFADKLGGAGREQLLGLLNQLIERLEG